MQVKEKFSVKVFLPSVVSCILSEPESFLIPVNLLYIPAKQLVAFLEVQVKFTIVLSRKLSGPSDLFTFKSTVGVVGKESNFTLAVADSTLPFKFIKLPIMRYSPSKMVRLTSSWVKSQVLDSPGWRVNSLVPQSPVPVATFLLLLFRIV